jgi:hypothetical protein
MSFLPTTCVKNPDLTKKPQNLLFQSIFIFIEEEIFFGWILRPNVLDGIKHFFIVFDLLKIFYYFEGGARAHREIYQFVFGGRPWGVFKV